MNGFKQTKNTQRMRAKTFSNLFNDLLRLEKFSTQKNGITHYIVYKTEI